MTDSVLYPDPALQQDSVLNRIVAAPPAPGHRLSVLRLDGAGGEAELTELYAAARRLAVSLRRHGIGRGDRIGILAANCLEWVQLDLAALLLGAVTAGFEPGKFGPDPALLRRYSLAVLFTDQPGDGSAPVPGIRPVGSVPALIEAAAPASPLPPVSYRPGDVTTIKFTSGSTGEPKGLAATAGSIDSSISAIQEMFRHGAANHGAANHGAANHGAANHGDTSHPNGDNLFVFLPLSLLQQRYWVYSALCFGHDITISSYEAAFLALRRAAPTVVMGVPGFFETAKKHIERSAAGSSAAELRTAAVRLFGHRIRYLWTGSAPARPSMLRFFTDLGMPIYEGYGMNETCIVSKNYPGASREGSVGQVLPGKKVLLDADGVISVHSDYPVNTRYEYAPPGESERVFAPDGTVRTGDLGYLDEDGFLFIRGRADDVIVLDNGKKVIVRPLEEYLKASPAIEECVVLCPTQTHLVAVVSAAGDAPDAEAIRARLAEANAAFGRDEQITELIIAPERFSTENGMLTAQYKPVRKRIQQAYWTPRSRPEG